MRMRHAKLVSKLLSTILFGSLLSNVLDQIVFQTLAFKHVPINDNYGLRFQVTISLLGISVVCVAAVVWLLDFAAYHLYEKKGQSIPPSIIYLIIAIGIGCITVPFGTLIILTSMRIVDGNFNAFEVLISLFLMGLFLIVKAVNTIIRAKQSQQQKQTMTFP